MSDSSRLDFRRLPVLESGLCSPAAGNRAYDSSRLFFVNSAKLFTANICIELKTKLTLFKFVLSRSSCKGMVACCCNVLYHRYL